MRGRIRVLVAGWPVLAGLAAQPPAEPPEQAQLARLLAAKLEQPFLDRAPWITDWRQARLAAKRTGKVIFAYFTRSYAP